MEKKRTVVKLEHLVTVRIFWDGADVQPVVGTWDNPYCLTSEGYKIILRICFTFRSEKIL